LASIAVRLSYTDDLNGLEISLVIDKAKLTGPHMNMPPKLTPQDHPLFELIIRDGPLVIAAPHIATYLPPEVAAKMTPIGLLVGETDYHVHKLFDAKALNATTLFANYSRYVIDLNRDPEGHTLYPGRFETGLCPLTDFAHQPLYKQGHEPVEQEISQRLKTYWQPYHQQLTKILAATKQRHGYALLIDAHSIRPHIPSLFEGSLPAINIGTFDGRSCAAFLRHDAAQGLRNLAFSHVIDGRFKGGYTTRHYGKPQDHIHAIQFEITQDSYLDMNDPRQFDPKRAQAMFDAINGLCQSLLRALISAYEGPKC
jgi:N-formylglutamate deformylase